MKNSITAAEAVVDALIEEGIEYVFGITGDTLLPLLDAMYHRQDEIRYVTARFETGATSMADTYSRVTGKIGCCLFHVGPSISNTVLGAWSANKDAVPLLMLSANMDTFRLERNIWHEFDVMSVFGNFTKWQGQLTEAKDTNRIMRTAFQALKSGMPGVVHVDFPKNILPHPIDVESTDLSLKGGESRCGNGDRCHHRRLGAPLPRRRIRRLPQVLIAANLPLEYERCHRGKAYRIHVRGGCRSFVIHSGGR